MNEQNCQTTTGYAYAGAQPNDVCPACGHCPHCGRRDTQPGWFQPYTPNAPTPNWPNPWVTYTCGGTIGTIGTVTGGMGSLQAYS